MRKGYTGGEIKKITVWEERYIPAFDRQKTFLQSFGNSEELRGVVNKIRSRPKSTMVRPE